MTFKPSTGALTPSLLGSVAVLALAAPGAVRAAPTVPAVLISALQVDAGPGASPPAAAQSSVKSPIVVSADDTGLPDAAQTASAPIDPGAPAPAPDQASTVEPTSGPVSATASVAAPATGDPLERVNRRFYNGSRRADRKLIGPVARGYRRGVPGPIRAGLHNSIANLGEPLVFVNDLLQLRITDAVHTLGRFCVNSTVGLAGLIDVASRNNLPHHDNDFGVTLGRYGLKPGAYLFLPVLGPSTVRDAAGMVVDYFISPWRLVHYGGERTVGYTKAVVGTIDTRANAEEDLQAIDNMSTDSYATTRSLYLQNREALVRGKPVGVGDLPDFDDPAAGATASPSTGSVSPTPGGAAEVQPSPAGVPQGEAAAPPAPGRAADSPSPPSADPPGPEPQAPREPLA